MPRPTTVADFFDELSLRRGEQRLTGINVSG